MQLRDGSYIYSNFHYGIGMSKSVQSYFDDMVGIDTRSELGLAKSGLKFTKDSNTTITEPTIAVKVPTGDVYFLGKTTGKIWKKDIGTGEYSLVHTNVNTAHKGGAYFNNYLYYWTSTKLGRFNLSTTWTDTWQTFSQETNYRPACVQNLSLFIGNGKYVSAVDGAETFQDNSLDLQPQYTVTTLDSYKTWLLIGTTLGDYINDCGMFIWDTYSPSWSEESHIGENGINWVNMLSNMGYVSAGSSGNIYIFNGAELEDTPFFTLRNATTSINPYLTTKFKGLPLFAYGGKVYSIGRTNRNLPASVCCEYVCSAGVNATIHSIKVRGTDLFLTWESSGTYGVDKLGTDRYNGTITTPEVEGRMKMVEVSYDLLPEGTSIGIETKSDGGSWVSKTPITDTNDRKVYFDGGLDGKYHQARITLNSSGSATPVIKSIRIL